MTESVQPQAAEAFEWTREVEHSGKTFEDLRDGGDFNTLDSKVATGLSNMLKHDELKRRVQKTKEEYQLAGKRMKGMHIFHMILDWYKLVEADGCIFDFTHLNAVKMVDQDLTAFISEWDYTIMGMKAVPEESILLSLFKAEIEKLRLMDVDMGEFNRMEAGDTCKSYTWLYDRCMKLLQRQRMSTARKEMVNRGHRRAAPAKGICADWYTHGKCNNLTTCTFDHPDKRAPAAPAGGRPSAGKPNFCREFALSGKCNKGKSCDAQKHKANCIFFKKRKCSKGAKCDFAHITEGSAAPAASRQNSPYRGRSGSRDSRQSGGKREGSQRSGSGSRKPPTRSNSPKGSGKGNTRGVKRIQE